METKKSTPTKIAFKNTWNGPNGAVHYYSIEFENGDKGSFGSKKEPQTKFAEGTETEYTREEKKNGEFMDVKIDKPAPANNGGGFKKPFDPEADKVRQKLIVRQSSLSNAVTLGVANGLSIAKSEDIFKMAEAMYEWVIKPVKDKL